MNAGKIVNLKIYPVKRDMEPSEVGGCDAGPALNLSYLLGLWPPSPRFRYHMTDHPQVQCHVLTEFTTCKNDYSVFRSHDINHDTKLDGLELLKAMGHNVDKQLALLDSLDIPEEAKEKQKEAVARQSIGNITLRIVVPFSH